MATIAMRTTEDAAPLSRALAGSLRTQGVYVADDDAAGCETPAFAVITTLTPESPVERLLQDSTIPTFVVCGVEVAPERVWSLIGAGAVDVVSAVDAEVAARIVCSRVKRVERINRLLETPAVRDGFVGRSPAWRRTLRQLVEVAHFSSAGVLITGESGTGKELAARLVHTLDARERKGPFVLLDCGTVSAELAGSELFGHVRGAYTGAIAEREGALSLANGGTLFLDELGELPLPVQAQLLRAIEEGAFKPVGAVQWKRANFRLVCATNRDLAADIAAGRFRLDLYHRVMAWHVHLPPLRERLEDILPLARHFAASAPGRRGAPGFDAAVERHLLTRDYPGNLRDLRQLMVRTMARHDGDGPVTPGDIPPEDRPGCDSAAWPNAEFEHAIRRGMAHGLGMKAIGRDAEAIALRLALEDADGNSRRAAETLGVSERAVQMRRCSQGGEPT